MSDLLHHSSELALNPMGDLKYLYLPDGSKKVVRQELTLSKRIRKYPDLASNLAEFGIRHDAFEHISCA